MPAAIMGVTSLLSLVRGPEAMKKETLPLALQINVLGNL